MHLYNLLSHFSADINECLPNEGLGPCAQNCTNTIGSFQCSCQLGYIVDGYACNGIYVALWSTDVMIKWIIFTARYQ